MAKKRKRKSPKGRRPKRRQARGSAWHWKQADCWYHTQPGTKKRKPLVDENGNRIRGKDNKEAAQVALARVKLSQAMEMGQAPEADGPWLVAKVCSLYLQHYQEPLWAAVGGGQKAEVEELSDEAEPVGSESRAESSPGSVLSGCPETTFEFRFTSAQSAAIAATKAQT